MEPVNHRKKENLVDGSDIPMGLGMALAKNLDAMNCFSAMPRAMKEQVIEHTHQIRSKKEMQAYVDSLVDTQWQTEQMRAPK